MLLGKVLIECQLTSFQFCSWLLVPRVLHVLLALNTQVQCGLQVTHFVWTPSPLIQMYKCLKRKKKMKCGDQIIYFSKISQDLGPSRPGCFGCSPKPSNNYGFCLFVFFQWRLRVNLSKRVSLKQFYFNGQKWDFFHIMFKNVHKKYV